MGYSTIVSVNVNEMEIEMGIDRSAMTPSQLAKVLVKSHPNRLPLSKVCVSEDLMGREEVQQEVVEDYGRRLDEDHDFNLPPITVFWDGKVYWLADGFHRFGAYTLVESEDIPVMVIEGTKRDALKHSLTANDTHGLRRSNADKRHVVLVALNDPEWGQWSDREIAKLCAVSNVFVGRMRASLKTLSEGQADENVNSGQKALVEESNGEDVRTYTKNGVQATMNVANIGKKPVDRWKKALDGLNQLIRALSGMGRYEEFAVEIEAIKARLVDSQGSVE